MHWLHLNFSKTLVAAAFEITVCHSGGRVFRFSTGPLPYDGDIYRCTCTAMAVATSDFRLFCWEPVLHAAWTIRRVDLPPYHHPVGMEKKKEKFEKNCERKNASPGNQKRTAGRSIRYSKFISNSDGPAGRDAITLGQEWKVRATCICLLHYTQYISFKLISRTHTHTETQLSVPKLFWQIQCHLLEKLATWHLTSRRDWARSRVQNFPKWLGYAQTLCLCKIESRTKSEPNKNSLVPWPGPLV